MSGDHFIRTHATGISAVVLRRGGKLVAVTVQELIDETALLRAVEQGSKPKKTKRKGRRK